MCIFCYNNTGGLNLGFVRVYFRDEQYVVNFGFELRYIVEFCCRLVLKLERFLKSVEISVLFVDNKNIHKLNLKYKNKNKPTDVLSFPTKTFDGYFEYGGVVVLGDIVISLQQAFNQLKLYGSSCFNEEVARLTIHSVLHLLGYDHENGGVSAAIMRKKEKILNAIVKRKFKFERAKNI